MSIKLPQWNELSKDEQVPILNLPTDKNYVIVGPPGSGKTILALHRAARLKKEGRQLHMLTYNRLLSEYLQGALNQIGLTGFSAQTYHAFMAWLFSAKLHKSVPRLPNDSYAFDWDEVHSSTRGTGKILDHIIIDETQDFPVELLRMLARISKNVTVFADTDQAIFQSTQATDLTGIFGTPNPYMLTRNYRNPKVIYEAAKSFCKPENIPADFKPFRESDELPKLIKRKSYEDINRAILRFADNFPSETIGVIVSNNAINATFNGLRKLNTNSELSIQFYKTMSKTDIDITAPGIKVLSYGAMKGLEFDTVIIPDMDRAFTRTADPERDMRLMYVALSRASYRLHIMHQGRQASFSYPDFMGVVYRHKDLYDWSMG